MSFFGGGTDIESFFKEYGGSVISTTFDKYCFVTVRHLPRLFNWSSEFGSKIMLVSDVPSVVDNNYACRTLSFEQTTDNNVVKTTDGVPRLINKVNDFRKLTHG